MNKIKWTRNALKDEAKNYEYRSFFQGFSQVAYTKARKSGTLDSICSHMKRLYCSTWTFDLCLEEAKKYKKYTEWYRTKGSGAKTACRRGWATEIKKIVWGW